MTEAEARDILNVLAQSALGGGWPDREGLRRFRESLERLRTLPGASPAFVAVGSLNSVTFFL